jgi:hypothetical protein
MFHCSLNDQYNCVFKVFLERKVQSKCYYTPMHRKGINVNDVQPKDILCDFCGLPTWSLGDPCIEGHQGSIICGACLASAYTSLVQSENGEQVEMPCRMCLEVREQPSWSGNFDPEATICLRCVRQSSTALEKSTHWEWAKPTNP